MQVHHGPSCFGVLLLIRAVRAISPCTTTRRSDAHVQPPTPGHKSATSSQPGSAMVQCDRAGKSVDSVTARTGRRGRRKIYRSPQTCEPRAVEWRMRLRRLAAHRRPQRRGFRRLLSCGEPTGFEDRTDERLQAWSGRVVEAGLPVMDRPPRDAGTLLALSQASPTAVAYEQASK